MEEVFRTVHGSRLYGMAHEGSDDDIFIVNTSERWKARQSMNGEIDTVRVGLDLFLFRAATGSHQTLEAMFSPYKQWSSYGLKYQPMIEHYKVTGTDVFEKYERTIRKFCYGDFKRRRHAVRLSFNLSELRRLGRFNPVMTAGEIVTANAVAERYRDDELADALYVLRRKQ